jgi:hypothetical protein
MLAGISTTGWILAAGQISRVIAGERLLNTWTDLLLLPYQRHTIMLQSVAHTFNPLLYFPGLWISEFAVIAVFIAAELSIDRILYVCVLVAVEWVQLLALGIVVGLSSACTSRKDAYPAVPVALGLLLAVARGSGALLATVLLNVPVDPRLALLVGPLMVSFSSPWAVGILLGGLYLLTLEVLVDRSFEWCIAHAGEN